MIDVAVDHDMGWLTVMNAGAHNAGREVTPFVIGKERADHAMWDGTLCCCR